ncbi:MAG: acetate--CoA ligase family protein [Candidatus Hadarchaeum sp.]|uniref:acetate--CoA ligase family protein n=1 Tax=Candidatus Hadarchaeum sp. TaxID=2883567 RepID=UPI003D09B085
MVAAAEGPQSIAPFFNPKSVAVIGASSKQKKIGYVIAKNFIESFQGKLFLVNPTVQEILSHKCYPSISSVPDDVDLAVIAVPAKSVAEVLKECGEKGVRAVVIISSGFRESSEDGAKMEEELLNLARKYRLRMMGPNCMGVFDSTTMVDTLFIPRYRLKRAPRGKIAFISQSGASGIAFLDWAAGERIGISKFASYGNATDVDEADLLDFLATDKETKVIAMYLEGIKEGRKFARIAREVTKEKPVIVLKTGATEAGAKAALSHTGSLSGTDEIFNAVVKQTGMIRVSDWEEMFDIARALAYQPAARGNRVAVITNGGGAGVMIADEMEKQGIKLVELGEKTVARLKEKFPPHVTLRNPMDLGGDADNERFREAISAVIDDEAVDSLLLVCIPHTPSIDLESFVDMVVDTKGKNEKPVVVCLPGGRVSLEVRELFEENGIPTYPTPARAALSLSALVKYGKLKNSDQAIKN